MPPSDNQQYKLEGSRINDLLSKLCKRGPALELEVDGQNSALMTALIKIDPATGIMEFDPPPDQPQDDLLVNRSIHVQGEMDGVAFSFVSRFTEIPLQAEIPQQVFYLQRRADFRVHVGMGEGVIIYLPAEDVGVIKGTVRNLSAGGVGIELQFTVDHAPFWSDGIQIDDCTLVLKDGKSLKCNIKLCHIDDHDHRHCYIGAEFMDLKPEDKRKLRLYVMDLERERKRLDTINDS